MKKLLLALTVLMVFMLVGCDNATTTATTETTTTENATEDVYDVYRALNDRYVQAEINDTTLYYHCGMGYDNEGLPIKVCEELHFVTDEELMLNLSYWFNEYDEIFNERLRTNELEQILYDILVVEYATQSCSREELTDYLYAYENEINIESERIETLLEMLDQQLDGE